jgi:hypothetical protein
MSNFNENPFADPSIQNATKNVQATQKSLDDYNPFAQQNYQSKPAPAIIPTSTVEPPPVSPNNVTFKEAPPTYVPQSAQSTTLNLTEIERQQQELERRAAELDRREQNLNTPMGNLVNNFPPLPMWCPGPLKPCFYQDIGREIPIEFQKWVRVLFYLWLFHTFTLGFNIIAALVVFIALGNGVTFGFSILFFVIFAPASYVCWFRPVYKGFRNDDSVNFMIFFFVFFIQCIFSVLACFGDKWFCGLILLIHTLNTASVGNIVAGVFVLLTTLCFLAIAVSDILILMKVHRLYRNTGASFEKAQAEFASGVMSNKNVQNAAATVITEGARSAMNNGTTGYGSPGKF